MPCVKAFLIAFLVLFYLPGAIGFQQASAAHKSRGSKRKSSRLSKSKGVEVRVKQPAKSSAEPASSPPATASASASNTSPPTRGPTRIDFDDRLIQGQTNKSGAVYLYDRKELKTRSMVQKRETFRDEIVGSVYDS